MNPLIKEQRITKENKIFNNKINTILKGASWNFFVMKKLLKKELVKKAYEFQKISRWVFWCPRGGSPSTQKYIMRKPVIPGHAFLTAEIICVIFVKIKKRQQQIFK